MNKEYSLVIEGKSSSLIDGEYKFSNATRFIWGPHGSRYLLNLEKQMRARPEIALDKEAVSIYVDSNLPYYFYGNNYYKDNIKSFERILNLITDINLASLGIDYSYVLTITLTDNREINNNNFYFEISDNAGEEGSNRVLFATNNRRNKLYRTFSYSILRDVYIKNFKQRVGPENVKESLSITRNGKPVKDLTVYKIILWVMQFLLFLALLLLNLPGIKKFFRDKVLDGDKELVFESEMVNRFNSNPASNEYYLKKFNLTGCKIFRFNWSAFLFQKWWLLRKRLYLPFLLFYLPQLMFLFLHRYFYFDLKVLYLSYNFAAMMFTGLSGNVIYRKKLLWLIDRGKEIKLVSEKRCNWVFSIYFICSVGLLVGALYLGVN